ncbi:ribonuclease H-like superfamily protein [Striga asiatica]|uniref:Ribonuclease H-like superfamily protein n=1 Tax=Striga asiatica TaxID=4170 RepID=A0A5A7RKK7_STRAF|nr:ribonuclease H-like superfamily protein [Striga asiatica]
MSTRPNYYKKSKHHLYGYAVRNPSTRKPDLTARIQQSVRHLNRPISIPPLPFPIHLHNPTLYLPKPPPEPLESLNRPFIHRPLWRITLPEENLVSRVPRQYLNKRNPEHALQLGCNRLQVCQLGFCHELFMLGSPGFRYEPAASGRAVREVATVRVLTEVDCCVES